LHKKYLVNVPSNPLKKFAQCPLMALTAVLSINQIAMPTPTATTAGASTIAETAIAVEPANTPITSGFRLGRFGGFGGFGPSEHPGDCTSEHLSGC
jgi:hypothetical protein